MELTKALISENTTETLTFGNAEKIEMGISHVSESLLINALTHLYSDPARAMVRETVSNARDAIAVAGNGGKVRISCNAESRWSTNPVIVVSDEGIGMSREEISRIYSQYGNSTKGLDFSQIGSFGFGSKSPLAFVSAFSVRSVKDGVATVASLGVEAEKNFCNIYESVPTDDHSGTTVTIPLPQGSEGISSVIGALQDLSENATDDVLVINNREIHGLPEKWSKIGTVEDIDVYIDNSDPSKILRTYINICKDEPNAFNLTMNVGGWPYVVNDRGFRDSNVLAVLKPGMVSFSPSRDDFIRDSRYHEVLVLIRGLVKKHVSEFIHNFVTQKFDEALNSSNPLIAIDRIVISYNLAPVSDFRIETMLNGVENYYPIAKDPASATFKFVSYKEDLGIEPIVVDLSVLGGIAKEFLNSFAIHIHDDGTVFMPRIEDLGNVVSLPVSGTPKKVLEAAGRTAYIETANVMVFGSSDRDVVLDVRYGWDRWDGDGSSADSMIVNPSDTVRDYLAKKGVPSINSSDVRAHEKELRKKERVVSPRAKKVKAPVQARRFDIEYTKGTGVSGKGEIVEMDDSVDFDHSAFVFLNTSRHMKVPFFVSGFIDYFAFKRDMGESDVQNLYVFGVSDDHYDLREIRKMGIERGRVVYDDRPRVNDYVTNHCGNISLRDFEEFTDALSKISDSDVRDSLRYAFVNGIQSSSWGIDAREIFKIFEDSDDEGTDVDKFLRLEAKDFSDIDSSSAHVFSLDLLRGGKLIEVNSIIRCVKRASEIAEILPNMGSDFMDSIKKSVADEIKARFNGAIVYLKSGR